MRLGGGIGGAVACAAGLCAAAPAWAGAWPMEPGCIQAISAIYIDGAERAFDDEGDASLDADFTKIESSTFIEWGATPRLTLIAQPVVQHVTLSPEPGVSDETSGFASSQIGARWLLGRPAGGALSVQAALIAPGTGENVIAAPLGDGGGAAEARLLVGRGWGGEDRGAFAEIQLARRWRFDDYPDETRLDATFGVRPEAGWMVLAQGFSMWRETGDAGALPLPASRSHKIQVSMVRRVNDAASIQIGAFETYAGRNVVDERAGFAALWLRLGR